MNSSPKELPVAATIDPTKEYPLAYVEDVTFEALTVVREWCKEHGQPQELIELVDYAHSLVIITAAINKGKANKAAYSDIAEFLPLVIQRIYSLGYNLRTDK